MLFLFFILLLTLVFVVGILLIGKLPFWFLAAILVLFLLRRHSKGR